MLISLLAPVLGTGIVGLFGRLFGCRGSMIITTSGLGISFVYSWWLLYNISGVHGYQFSTLLFPWFSSIVNLDWSFIVDEISAIMLVVVSTVSFVVHIYSIAYMGNDPHASRFFTYLSLFTTSMFLLVLGNNLFILFLGWEGVGLVSYLLINYWFTRLQANKAALKAMMVNRVGDVSFIAAGGLALYFANSLNFPTMLSSSFWLYNSGCISLIALSCVFYLFAAVGKSAQIGLHTWLPDAMEGPTPVSALIHAATMVTAGVFLLIRVSAWLDISQSVLYVIMIFGAATAIFAGSVGITQYDIKRVVAYSTCSQLGYMVLICGCSLFSIGLFHLFNHAFFKALLSLGSGSIIHAMSDEQDMRKYGLLSWFTPFVGQAFLIASIALMGLPFLAGFYSKDSILEILISSHNEFALWGYWVGLGAALLTTIYSFKIAYWTFYASTSAGFRRVLESWHNPSTIELGVLSALTILAIFSGYVFKDQFLGLGSNFFQVSLRDLGNLSDAEFIPSYIKLIPLVYTLLTLGVAYLLSSERHTDFIMAYSWNLPLYRVFNFLSHKWYFNLIQNMYVSQKLLNAGYETFWIWDRWLLEQFRVK